MLSFQEQKYYGIILLALLIVVICLYQSRQMDGTFYSASSLNHISQEGFSDTDGNSLPAYSRIYRTGKLLDEIRSAQGIKYADYASANAAFPVTAATLLEMQRNELGKINKGLQVEFIQALQDAEINGLKERLEQVINEGKQKGILLANSSSSQSMPAKGHPLRIRHLQSGAVYSTVSRERGPSAASKPFGIILDKNRGTCIQYISQPSSQNNDGHTIEVVGCDYNPELSNQRFFLKKITSNDTFNRALHPDYTMYAIPEYNTLNAYPYYVVVPKDDTKGVMCLTIDSSGVSIEPCIGKQSQRFNIA